jgi:Xaa-Pro dipeptidase
VSYVDAGTLELVRRTTAAEIVSSADLVQLTQAVLDEAQIASHRRAAAHCLAAKDAAFAYVAERLRSGAALNEYEVQQVVASHLTRAGLFFDHDAIVAVNANAALPHYAPSAGAHSPIQPGDMLLIDLWGKEQKAPLDCYADITWVAYCGSQPPASVQDIFATAAAGRDAAVAFINERMAAGHTVYGYEVDDACRGVIARAGYGDAFIHRTGHSLGVTTHYNGVNIDNLETRDRRSLMPGVMFTIEPGIYLPDFVFDPNLGRGGLGLRTEINCLVHADHVEVTTLPLQTEIIALM